MTSLCNVYLDLNGRDEHDGNVCISFIYIFYFFIIKHLVYNFAYLNMSISYKTGN